MMKIPARWLNTFVLNQGTCDIYSVAWYLKQHIFDGGKKHLQAIL